MPVGFQPQICLVARFKGFLLNGFPYMNVWEKFLKCANFLTVHGASYSEITPRGGTTRIKRY